MVVAVWVLCVYTFGLTCYVLARPVRERVQAKVEQAKVDVGVEAMRGVLQEVLVFTEKTMNAQQQQMNAVMAQAHQFATQAGDVMHSVVKGWSPNAQPMEPVVLPVTRDQVVNAGGLPTTLGDLDDDWQDPSYDFFPAREGSRAVIEHVGGVDGFLHSMRNGD